MMKLNQTTRWFSVMTIAGCLLAALPAWGQLGGFGTKIPGVGGSVAVDGGAFLKQLTPGAADFAKAYSLYCEGLGLATNAASLAKLSEQLNNGGQFDKAANVLMEGARTNIQEILKQKKEFDDQARAKFSEGNKAYREGLVKWTVVSAAVSDVLAKNPKAGLTNPDLTLAAAACVKGLGDMTKFVGIMEQVSKAKSDANK
jgi:hypothetical protein